MYQHSEQNENYNFAENTNNTSIAMDITLANCNIGDSHLNGDNDTSTEVHKKNNEIISPINSFNLKRQRCVFTANPTTKFNVSATPFISSQTDIPTRRENYDQENVQRQTSSPTINCTTIGTSPIQHKISMFHPLTQSTPQIKMPTMIDSRIWRNPSIPRQQTLNYYKCSEDAYCQMANSMPPYKILYTSHPKRDNTKSIGAAVLLNGILQLILRDDIRIDITLDKAIRIFNYRSQLMIALSNHNGGAAALVHPNGKVYQAGSRVEIMAHDGMGNNDFIRYAKMWHKGISFTSENCPLIYLVDSAGTRTTTDSFTKMTIDLPSNVFYQNSEYGPEYTESALSVLHNSSFWCNEDGTETYDINDFRISQAADGMIKITRPSNKCLIRTSLNGSATVTTPFLHCTASLGQTSHLFVRRGERRMHFDGSSFVVRNAGHSAGFDESNLLNVY